MVKIINPGDKEKLGAVKRFRCTECGCEWEANKSEYVNETDFRNGHIYVMDCPNCGKRRCYGDDPDHV